jgi:hypothetical protein
MSTNRPVGKRSIPLLNRHADAKPFALYFACMTFADSALPGFADNMFHEYALIVA